MDNQEVETVEAQTPAGNEPVSQREDVHNDVAAAIKQLKGGDEPAKTVDDQPEPKSDHPSDPARYADGKFKPTKAEAAPEKVEAPAKITAPDAGPKPIAQPSTAVVEAPGPWAADAKAEWSKLPPAVQAAVMKREAEMNEGGRQWSEEKRRYQATLAPLAQETQKLGLSVDQGLNALLGAHRMLQQNAPAAIAQLAQQYGVDLANLASNPPAPQAPQFDPMVQQLEQRYSQLEAQLNGFLQNQTLSVVEKFAQDHPHYAAVEGDLVHLVPMVQQSNPGLSPHEVLEKAYERAIWINPEVRAKLIEEQMQQAQAQQAEALKAKQAQAQKAAVSIKASSNGAASVPKMPPAGDESVYDTVRRTLHQLRQ